MKFTITRRKFSFALLAATLASPISPAMASGYANPDLLVSADQLVRLIGADTTSNLSATKPSDLLILDIRAEEEYQNGHIPGAVLLEANSVVANASPITGSLLPEDQLVSLLGNTGIGPKTKVILYDDRGGFHAARMFWLLEYLGHQNVAILNGGLSAWIDAGGNISKDKHAARPVQFTAAPMPRRHATADYIMSHENEPGTAVVDVRPAKMYEDGHIPWAKNIPWKQNLAENGLFKPADDLAAHFAGHGVTPDRNIVIHCQTGLASSHSYVALRLLGYPKVRVYHRSWAEWGTDDDLPRVVGS